MQLRYRSVLPLAAVLVALAVAPSFAAKPEPNPMAPPTGPSGSIQLGSINSAPPLCQMGILPPAANAYGYILPPDDQYYTLLNPGQCPACHNDGYLLTVAHMELFFDAPCQIPVTVSITPAFFNTANGCYEPNPFAPPICAPVSYVINDGGILNQCVDYALPLPAGCCITGPAFLTIEFDQGSCANGRPAFCGPASCQLCTQYNYYPGAGFPGDDLCGVLAPFGLTGNIMYVDAECCSPTSTAPGSWGMLKTLYR